MPKTYQKVSHAWKESDVEKALQAIRNGSSIRSTAKEYKMSESMLRKRMIRIKEGRQGQFKPFYSRTAELHCPCLYCKG